MRISTYAKRRSRNSENDKNRFSDYIHTLCSRGTCDACGAMVMVVRWPFSLLCAVRVLYLYYIYLHYIHNSNTKMRVEKNFILNSENIYPIQINRSDNGNVMWFGRISYYTFLCDYPHLSTHPWLHHRHRCKTKHFCFRIGLPAKDCIVSQVHLTFHLIVKEYFVRTYCLLPKYFQKKIHILNKTSCWD